MLLRNTNIPKPNYNKRTFHGYVEENAFVVRYRLTASDGASDFKTMFDDVCDC